MEYHGERYLDNVQQHSGQLHSSLRDDPLRAKGVKDARCGTREEMEQRSPQGSRGEVAFALAFNLPFEVSGFNKYDFQMAGHDIDVKTSVHPNVFIAKRHLHKDFVYVGVQEVDYSQHRIIGWIASDEISDKYLADPNKDGCSGYLIPFHNLHPFKQLIGGQGNAHGQ